MVLIAFSYTKLLIFSRQDPPLKLTTICGLHVQATFNAIIRNSNNNNEEEEEEEKKKKEKKKKKK